MSTVDEVKKLLESRFDKSAAEGLDVVFQLNIEGEQNYQLIVKDGAYQLLDGDAEDPDVTLITDLQTLYDIISGEENGFAAFTSGKLKAEGDLTQAMKLESLFPSA